MKIKNIIFMTALTALFLAVGVQFSSSAMAFNIPVQVVESQKGEVTADIKGYVYRNGEKLPATNVNPGEVIIWELTAHNSYSVPVEKVKIADDIPTQMVYVTNSASNAEFSIDGNNFSRAPMVRDSQGRLVSAPVSAYRAIRFTVSLQANETKTVTYKTTVK